VCAVLGYYSLNPTLEDRDTLVRLWQESKIRGLHAFGFASGDDGEFRCTKVLRIKEIIENTNNLWPFTRLLGHCRYSTSGDYREMENNQPVLLQDQALVFNGIVSMKSRSEYEAEFKKSYATENDGEIVLRKYLDGEDWEGFVSKGKFSFAGGIFNKTDFLILRNKNRPLYFAYRGQSVFIGSTRNILERSGLKGAKEIPAGRVIDVRKLVSDL